MVASLQQKLSAEESREYWPTITLPAELSGAEWKPLDASSAATSLKSARKTDEYSPAHPIIASIRAEAICPPEAFKYEIRWWRQWMLIECQCGTVHPMGKADIRKAITRGQNLYCTKTCMSQALSAEFQIHFCPECANPVPKSRNLTCSDECLIIHRAKKHRKISCPQCGTDFRPVSHLTQYCGKECADRAHSSRMIGQGNSNYKDGTSYAKWFRSMRPLILERDNSQCVACQESPTITFVRNGETVTKSGLVVHHIDEDTRNNRAENLITLCHDCHMTHHKSHQTPFPWLPEMAAARSTSMTSRWKARVTSLQTDYLSTTA